MKAIVLNKVGGPDVLKISEVEKPKIKNPNEVLVKVKYAGINYADIISRKGFYSWAPDRPYILGLEVTGEIEEVGSGVDKNRIGERVMVGTQQGGYAEYIVIESVYALRVPEFYNWKESGSFGVQFFTAWVALHEMARVRSGEIALIHAAAGGVGSGAVLLAKAHGMEVFGTASPSKRTIVEDLGATYLTYENFDKDLIEMNKRPHFVCESIGGLVFKKSFNCLAPMGRTVQIGASGIQFNKWNPISLYKAWRAVPRVSMSKVIRDTRGFMGLHVGYMMKFPELLIPSWNAMINVIEENELQPIYRDNQIFPMSKAGDAHQFMSDRKSVGKILLDPTK